MLVKNIFAANPARALQVARASLGAAAASLKILAMIGK